MRRTALGLGALTVLSSAAYAADLPPRPVPSYKAPAYVTYNWTGFYVGGHIGYGWSKITGTDPLDGTSADATLRGFLGGGQVGYNYQIGSWVLGIEGDYSWADVKRTEADPLGLGAGEAEVKHDYFATITGRLGYAFDRWLWYLKGGGAWTRDKWDVTDGIGGTATGSFNRSGWLIGGGVEYAFWNSWSAKLEYNYLSFGGQDQTLTTAGGLGATPATDVSAKTHLLKLGINYKFF